jgi:nucleotide-binding universal stress UspA family protein
MGMFRISRPILAAIRLDETATEVLRQAVDLARHYRVKLYVCHVLHDLMSVRPLFPQLQLDNALRFAEFEATARSMMVSRVGAFINAEGSACELMIEYGTEHSAIIRAAERIGVGLIVVGHGSQEHRLSGISERVVRYAHCPVLIARPTRKGCVLAATDFSDPATPAVEAAASEAARRVEDLTIIHVIDMVPYVIAPDAPLPGLLPVEFSDSMRRVLQEHLDSCVAHVSAKKGILADGPAKDAILDASDTLPADLILVGTHGRSGLNRLAIGSVAEGVVRGAVCSVLVVRLHSRSM